MTTTLDLLAWAKLAANTPPNAFTQAERTNWPEALTPYQIAVLVSADRHQIKAVKNLLQKACSDKSLKSITAAKPQRGISFTRSSKSSEHATEDRITPQALWAWLDGKVGAFEPLAFWLPQVVEPPSEKPEAQGQGLGKGETKTLKKADLIDRLKKSWESIERDLKETSKPGYEGLADARIRSGIYDVDKAIEWAKQNGRWKESTSHLAQRILMRDLPVSKINKPDW